MNEVEAPKPPIKEGVQKRATLIFSAAHHKLEQLSTLTATAASTLSRIRLVVEPEKQEIEERKREKFQAIEPYINKMPLDVVELLLDHDKLPFVDKHGNTSPSLYQLRKERREREKIPINLN